MFYGTMNLFESLVSRTPSHPLSCWIQVTLLLVISHLHKLTATKEGIPRCASWSFPNKKFFWQMFHVFMCFPKKSYTVLKAFWLRQLWALGGISTNPYVTLWERFLITAIGKDNSLSFCPLLFLKIKIS